MTQAQAGQTAPERERAANVEPDSSNRVTDNIEENELDAYDVDGEEEIGRRAAELLLRLRRQIREQPLTAAGGAFILGFAIGKGVPKFLARAGVAVGLRIVMQRMFGGSTSFAD